MSPEIKTLQQNKGVCYHKVMAEPIREPKHTATSFERKATQVKIRQAPSIHRPIDETTIASPEKTHRTKLEKPWIAPDRETKNPIPGEGLFTKPTEESYEQVNPTKEEGDTTEKIESLTIRVSRMERGMILYKKQVFEKFEDLQKKIEFYEGLTKRTLDVISERDNLIEELENKIRHLQESNKQEPQPPEKTSQPTNEGELTENEQKIINGFNANPIGDKQWLIKSAQSIAREFGRNQEERTALEVQLASSNLRNLKKYGFDKPYATQRLVEALYPRFGKQPVGSSLKMLESFKDLGIQKFGLLPIDIAIAKFKELRQDAPTLNDQQVSSRIEEILQSQE